MWYQEESKNYRNLETGHRFVVQPYDDGRGVRTWEIRSASPQGGQNTLAAGYQDEDEAREALADFLKKNKINAASIDAPVYEDEADDTQDSESVEDKGGAE